MSVQRKLEAACVTQLCYSTHSRYYRIALERLMFSVEFRHRESATVRAGLTQRGRCNPMPPTALSPCDHGGGRMNSDQLQGKWKELKGMARERWGRLTDDDLDVI